MQTWAQSTSSCRRKAQHPANTQPLTRKQNQKSHQQSLEKILIQINDNPRSLQTPDSTQISKSSAKTLSQQSPWDASTTGSRSLTVPDQASTAHQPLQKSLEVTSSLMPLGCSVPWMHEVLRATTCSRREDQCNSRKNQRAQQPRTTCSTLLKRIPTPVFR
jgi:hypothetical protein